MNKKVIYVLSITIIIITSIIAIIIFNGFINMSDIKNTNAKLNSNEAIELKLNKADSDNEELYVRINNLSISAMTLGIFFSKDSLEYVNNMENSNYSNGRLLYTWVSETGKNEKISDIGPFKFKRKNDSDSKIVVTGEFYNENGEKIDFNSGSINVSKVKSNTSDVNENDKSNVDNTEQDNNINISKDNTNLSVLRLNYEGISPDFSKDIKEYYIVVDEKVKKFDMTVIAENSNSTITITGNDNLKTGLNTINISVKSEDKTKETNYKIYVTKTSNIENANANLENLAVEHGSLIPEFNTNVTNYKVEVSNNIENVNVLAVPEKINANVKIRKSNKLEIGDNVVEIIVTAEDNITKKKYIVTVHRRNNEEEEKTEEHREVQAEKLSTILQQNNNINDNSEEIREETNNKTPINEEKRNKNENIYVYISAGIVIAIIIIFILYKKRKNK